MVHRTKEGCGDVSDNGVDEALQGFVLIRKIEREMDVRVCAGHEQFNCTLAPTIHWRPHAMACHPRMGPPSKFIILL